MILTVTLNAGLDVTCAVSRLTPGETHRVRVLRAQAGGKGINVARVLHRLGEPVLATGLAGGCTGRLVERDLDLAGIRHRLVHVPGESRRNLAVLDEATGQVTEFNEPGPEVPDAAWEELRRLYASLLTGGRVRVVVLSGSLPPGVPNDAYAQLCRLAVDAGVPAYLDAAGPALRAGLDGRPALVKPNREELAGVAGGVVPGPARDDAGFEPRAWLPAVQALRAAGAGSVVATFAADGLVAVTEEGTWHARPPCVAGNPVGAGDAAMAALAWGEARGLPWPERLQEAAALSAAAVASPVAGAFVEEVYRELRGRVQVRALA